MSNIIKRYLTANQGSINFVPMSPPPGGAATVTAANEGLSLSGTTVQLGNQFSTSALSQITGIRHIYDTGGIQLNSNLAALPNVYLRLNATGISGNVSGGIANIGFDLRDNRIVAAGSQLFFQPDLFTIKRAVGAGAAPIPNFTLQDDVFGYSNNQTPSKIVLTTDAGIAISVVGVNAAGAVFASKFVNTSTAAPASVNSQWYVDSNVQDFSIQKHSNAHATFPGGTLFQNIGGVANSQLCLRASGTTPLITFQIGTNQFGRITGSEIVFGDNAAATTGATLNFNIPSATLVVNNTANSGQIQTGSSILTGGAAPWQLGMPKGGAAVLDASQWIEVGINGALVKLAVIV
jgi:hypothetical protein